MTRGALLFAFNNGTVDYYEMAIRTSKRINKFLNLPVTVVTGPDTDLSKYDYQFDNVIIEEPDTSNTKQQTVWINKGRHKAYELSPYDETLVLDTDYLINSDTLLKPFELYDDFMCHKYTSFLMLPEAEQEELSPVSFQTLWATVIYFKKTTRAKQIFECMSMVQHNYTHYCNLFKLASTQYRNDHSLAISLRIVNGGTENPQDYIPWNLVHVNDTVKVYRDSDTSYTLMKQNERTEYLKIKDSDFHLLNKQNFMELTDE